MVTRATSSLDAPFRTVALNRVAVLWPGEVLREGWTTQPTWLLRSVDWFRRDTDMEREEWTDFPVLHTVTPNGTCYSFTVDVDEARKLEMLAADPGPLRCGQWVLL